MPAPLAAARRRAGRRWRRPVGRGDGVDEDTGGDLIGGVVGQHDDGRGLDAARSATARRGSRRRSTPSRRRRCAAPARCGRRGRPRRRRRAPSGGSGRRRGSAAGREVLQATASRRSPARCPCPGRADPRSAGSACPTASTGGVPRERRRRAGWCRSCGGRRRSRSTAVGWPPRTSRPPDPPRAATSSSTERWCGGRVFEDGVGDHDRRDASPPRMSTTSSPSTPP